MGKRRMTCTDITRSDAFLDMSATSRLLYYDLIGESDDEGFVDNPKTIMRITGATINDLETLVNKKFVIIPDETKGVVVIKHWYIHNYIRKDRMVETNYKDLKALLGIDENGCYTMSTNCQPNVNQLTTKCQHKLSKDKLSKDKLIESKGFTPPSLEEINSYIREKNLNVDGDKFFNYFNEGNWVDSKGNKVKNWKQKLQTWCNFNNNQSKNGRMPKEAIPVYDDSKNPDLSIYMEKDNPCFDKEAFEQIMKRREQS